MCTGKSHQKQTEVEVKELIVFSVLFSFLTEDLTER